MFCGAESFALRCSRLLLTAVCYCLYFRVLCFSLAFFSNRALKHQLGTLHFQQWLKTQIVLADCLCSYVVLDESRHK